MKTNHYSMGIPQLLNSEFCTNFISAICSNPLVYIPTAHYSIVENFLIEGFKEEGKLHSLLGINEQNAAIVDFNTKKIVRLSNLSDFDCGNNKDKETVLKQIRAREGDYEDVCIFIIKDFFEELSRKSDKNNFKATLLYYLHQIADLYERGYYNEKKKLMCVIVMDPTAPSQLPAGIIDFFTIVNLPLPGMREIHQIVSDIPISIQYSSTEKKYIQEELTRNLLGLSYQGIDSILNRLRFYSSNLTKASIKFALEEKKRIISKSGLIQILDTDVDIEDVGGLKNLKTDLLAAKKMFAGLNIISQERVNLPYPKGILIIGMPGCGKSLIAKAVANLFHVSLLRLDMDKLLGQYVGQSDENLRRALHLADAAHPCVLWIDEVEKAFAGASGNGGNSMLIQRLMGQFLTWMQERKTAVYIVATANSPMKPEFMRKGRFDEVYFVDFPNEEESLEILKSKLRRYMSDNSVYDLTNIWSGNKEDDHQLREIARMMRVESKKEFVYSFSGAEIESLVNTIMTNAYVKEYDFTKIEQERHSIKIKIEDFRNIIGEFNSTDKKGMINNIQALQKSKNGQMKLPIELIREMQTQYNFKKA